MTDPTPPSRRRRAGRARCAGVLAIVALLGAACGGDDASSGPDAAAGSAEAVADLGALPPVTDDYSWPGADPPAGHYPVTVESCGEEVTFDQAPRSMVVNDDNMVEMAFALGLTDHMAAYAAAGPRLRLAAFADDYAAVEDLGEDYFSLEPLLGVDPDFVFSGWNYGFGEESGITPDSLADLGIASYALNESCRRIDGNTEASSIAEFYADMRNLAAIFGVPERAEALIAHWDERLARVAERLPDGDPVPVFSYGWGEEAAGTAPGLTIVPELYERAGAVNVFADLPEMWGTVSWEAVVDRAPEVIVVTDYGGSAAGQRGEEKIAFLTTVAGIDEIPAIAGDRILVFPQEAVNPGIRFIDGIEELAATLHPEAFEDLVGTDGFGLAPTAS